MKMLWGMVQDISNPVLRSKQQSLLLKLPQPKKTLTETVQTLMRIPMITCHQPSTCPQQQAWSPRYWHQKQSTNQRKVNEIGIKKVKKDKWRPKILLPRMMPKRNMLVIL